MTKSITNKDNNLIFTIIYSILIAILPYLDLFPSRIFSSFTLSLSACLILVVLSIIKLVFYKEKILVEKFDVIMIIFSLYICLSNFISNSFFPKISTTNGYFSTYSTAFFIITIVCIFNNKNFNNNIIFNTILILSIVATVGVLLQTIIYYTIGTYLKLIPIEFMTNGIQKQYFRLFTNSMEGALFRPCSFFLEPSYFCEYVVCALCWCLYKTSISNEIKWYVLGGVLSLGMILTTSGMGIFLVVVSWLSYVVFNKKKTIKASTLFLIVISIIFVFVFITKSNILDKAIARIYSTQTGLHSSRFDESIYFSDLNILNKIFGVGYGREPEKVYFTNIVCFLIRIGYFGIVFFSSWFLILFKKSDLFGKIFIFIYVIIFISSGTYSYFYFVFYLSIIQSYRFRNKKVESECII